MRIFIQAENQKIFIKESDIDDVFQSIYIKILTSIKIFRKRFRLDS